MIVPTAHGPTPLTSLIRMHAESLPARILREDGPICLEVAPNDPEARAAFPALASTLELPAGVTVSLVPARSP